MAWFKVDDGLHEHPKAHRAGVEAIGLWTLAGSYSGDNLTDGFVPRRVLSRWVSDRKAAKLADVLLEVGLWRRAEKNGESGYVFHEWDERNPTRAEKAAQHLAKVEAGRLGGQRSGESRRQANGKQAASPLVKPPSRPIPLIAKSVSQLTEVSARVENATTDGLDLQVIASAIGRNVTDEQAKLAAWEILSRANGAPNNPTRYVVKAIELEPERYRPPEPERLVVYDPCEHGYSNADVCPFCRRKIET